MKVRLIVWLLLGVSAALAAAPACAGQGDGGGGEGGGHRFRHRFLSAGEAGPGPVAPAAERADGGPEFRRGDMPMFRRMSPEERRQLRRDIRSAGYDVYHRPLPPPPPPFEPPGR